MARNRDDQSPEMNLLELISQELKMLERIRESNRAHELSAQSERDFKLLSLGKKIEEAKIKFSKELVVAETNRGESQASLKALEIQYRTAEELLPGLIKDSGFPFDPQSKPTVEDLHDFLMLSEEVSRKECRYAEGVSLESHWDSTGKLLSAVSSVLTMLSYWFLTGSLTIDRGRVQANAPGILMGLGIGLIIGIAAASAVRWAWVPVGETVADEEANVPNSDDSTNGAASIPPPSTTKNNETIPRRLL